MEKLDLYKCNICGNLVQVLMVGAGELVCCGEPMQKLEAKKQEMAIFEKHVPIFIKNENGEDEIRVGEILHPMTEEHHIVFIEAVSEDKNHVQLKFLHAGEKPKMLLNNNCKNLVATEYCNIHGLWESQNSQ